MAFFKRLFRRDSKPPPALLRGAASDQTGAQQAAMRRHMEDEVAADRARRGATDERPGQQKSTDGAPVDHDNT
jgi:hypothetical protein